MSKCIDEMLFLVDQDFDSVLFILSGTCFLSYYSILRPVRFCALTLIQFVCPFIFKNVVPPSFLLLLSYSATLSTVTTVWYPLSLERERESLPRLCP
jgi:hypothetical protein